MRSHIARAGSIAALLGASPSAVILRAAYQHLKEKATGFIKVGGIANVDILPDNALFDRM